MNGRVKNLIVVLVFTVVFVGSLLALSFLFTPKNNYPDVGMIDWRSKAVLAEPENTIDAVIVGDSQCYCSFSPLCIWEEQGIATYCCASVAQPLNHSEEYLRNIFKKHSPKIVFLETDQIAKPLLVWQYVRRQLLPAFSVLTYHNRWKTMKIEEVSAPLDYTYLCDLKGYSYSSAIEAADASKYMLPTDRSSAIYYRNRNYVNRIKKLCEENGAKLVIISMPSIKNWNMKKHNGITALAQEIGVEYIDLNLMREEVPIDWSTDTRDKGDHLNNDGAVKVSSYIGKYLAETGWFSDHRSDSSYQKWNEFVNKLKKTVEKDKAA